MKIAIITQFPADPNAPDGGVESVSITLVKALRDLGKLELQVVTTDTACSQEVVENWDGVKIHRLPRSGRMLSFATGLGRRLIKQYLYALSPHVVHAHDVYGLMVKGLNLPRVLTIHGFIHEDTFLSGKNAPWIRSKLWRLAETSSWADQPHIISISPYVRERVTGLSRAAIHDIENPVSEEFFDVVRDEHAGTIFSAGRFSALKNTLALVEAFARVAAGRREARLRLAGSANGAYAAAVRDRIHRLGLTDRVSILGQIAAEQVRQELSHASAFALVSLQENSPMAVAEAMAAGVPVIASNRCGMPYMVRDNESGYLVDPENPEGIAQRINQLLDSKQQRSSMGTRARQVAEQRFHPALVAQRTYEVYLAAAGGGRSQQVL
jgi:glycosyltransferase involved in cell wall biosynthesis